MLMPALYCSTSCFKASSWNDLFSQAYELNIQGIELSFFHGNPQELEDNIFQAQSRGLIILGHNYFNDDSGLVVNLSAPDKEKCQQSLDFVLSKLEWCAKFNIKRYSFHAGFAANLLESDLGNNVNKKAWGNVEHANALFVDNLHTICKRALELGVDIAFENNVLTQGNLFEDGQSYGLLCVTPDDILKIFSEVNMQNLRLLLDVGHLHISATTLGLPFMESILQLLPYTSQVHLHSNDGHVDSHTFQENAFLTLINLLGSHNNLDCVLECKVPSLQKLKNFINQT